MKHLVRGLGFSNFRMFRVITSSVLTLTEILAIGSSANAQSFQSSNVTGYHESSTTAKDQDHQPKTFSQSYVDFILALKLADDGSKPEALRKLARSLRLQPQDNPASALAFELITEQRTNSRLILRGHTAAVLYATYSPDGTKIVTTSADNTARLWDAHTGELLTAPLQHKDAVLVADFSSDGKRLVTGSEDGKVRIWDVETGHPIGAPITCSGAIKSVKFSPDGKIVATGTDEGSARTWNTYTGQAISPPVVYHEAVFTIGFSPDGSQALTATGDGVADLLDPKTGAKLLKPLRHKNAIFTAAFSPDGKTILTSSGDHNAMTWDAKTGEPLGPIFHHAASINVAAFNQDASRVVTASWDHTARVWDAKTGQPVTPPLQHGEAVLKAAFSPDGNLVATASIDHTARLWDASSGEPLRLPFRTQDGVTTVAFNPSGSALLVGCNDSSVQIFDMPPREESPSWLADLAEFAAAQNKYDQSKPPDLNLIRTLRTQLLASKSNDPWATFGRWYFSESDVRSISPWSTVSLEQYVNSLIALGDNDSLTYASTLSYDHPSWMVRIVSLRNKLALTAPNKTEKH